MEFPLCSELSAETHIETECFNCVCGVCVTTDYSTHIQDTSSIIENNLGCDRQRYYMKKTLIRNKEEKTPDPLGKTEIDAILEIRV